MCKCYEQVSPRKGFLTLFMNILYFISENETFMIQIQDTGCGKRESNYNSNNFTNKDMNNKNEKKKNDFMFSHWVLYPAWFLCIFVMLGCAFLVVWYGISFGNKKSTEWLQCVMIFLVSLNLHIFYFGI